jgi:Putative adhesin
MRASGILVLLALTAGALPAQEKASTDFSWDGRIPRGSWLIVRNLNGRIEVERGAGDRAEVTAVKRVRRGNADDVRIELKKSGDDVIVCAIWNDNTECDANGYRSRGDGGWRRGNEISVEFRVRLPEGVKLTASTVNGGVSVDGATSEVIASTVNGGVTAHSSGGPVRASTVNGSIDVRMRDLGADDLEFETVNGSIEVELPTSLDAELDMRTVNGRVESDYPLTLTGRINPRHIRATIGKGGRRLKFATVNGSVELRKAP